MKNLSLNKEFSPWNKIRKINFLLGIMLFVLGISLTVIAAPSDLDPTFGNGGKVVSSPDGSQLTAGSGMAIQPDGKIVMVGSSNDFNFDVGFIVARYNVNGSLDSAFGNNGWISITFGAHSHTAASVAVQPDGKIVIGGNVTFQTGNTFFTDLAVARLNSDGSLDTSFDGDGKVTVSFNELTNQPNSYVESLRSLKIANDGKIVIAGDMLNNFAFMGTFILGRFNANGSLDESFGTGGKFLQGSIGGQDKLNDLVVLPDNSMVVVGQSGRAAGLTKIAIKYNISGALEWSYIKFTSGLSGDQSLQGVAVQPDGKLIVVGSKFSKSLAVRLNADGTEDPTFNSETTTPNGDSAYSVAIQPDGKIVTNVSSSAGTFSLIRYNSNGSLDSGFAGGGIAYASPTDGSNTGRNVLVQPDGKVLVGGWSSLSSPTRSYFTMVRYQGGNVVSQKTSFDYDGDGRSDVSVFRPADSVWYLNQSTNGFAAARFGVSTDRIVPADYDGDGKTDIAIYRDGVWWILKSGNSAVGVVQFGITEDKPQKGDYDGDGKDDIAVFRPSSGVWYVLRSTDNGYYSIPLGISEDIPQSADYDGDGKTDLAVFRPSNGTWYVQKSTGGYLFTQFGSNGDRPTANDYDGDGKTDIAVWRPSNGNWYIFRSSDNQYTILSFGLSGDIPVAADYDGDRKADIAVFRPSDRVWYQLLSTGGNVQQTFGLNNDRPTPSAFNP